MPNANQRVGEHVLQERIAAGAFGEVWKANHHVWHDQVVAVKIPTDPNYVRDLQREGTAVHGLQHPNIVRAMGFDPYAETPYLVMEYIPGTSLRPLIAGKKLSPADAIAVMKQVLAGLAYAHRNNVVHRDIKPENILVHERAFKDGFGVEGVVKVTDFGLGKTTAMRAESIALSQSASDDHAREIAGTLEYMAPEQRQGAIIDGRADLYACGVVLYEMLTGEKPAGTDVPSDINRQSPRQLDEVFRRSYARLDKRFATAEEMSAALSAAPPVLGATRTGVPPIPGKPPFVTPPPVSGKRTTCPQCRGAVEANDQFCMHCGVQMVENVRRCPQCGAYPDPTDHHCIFCGQTLTMEAGVR